jgi:hypothetical protein
VGSNVETGVRCLQAKDLRIDSNTTSQRRQQVIPITFFPGETHTPGFTGKGAGAGRNAWEVLELPSVLYPLKYTVYLTFWLPYSGHLGA